MHIFAEIKHLCIVFVLNLIEYMSKKGLFKFYTSSQLFQKMGLKVAKLTFETLEVILHTKQNHIKDQHYLLVYSKSSNISAIAFSKHLNVIIIHQ